MNRLKLLAGILVLGACSILPEPKPVHYRTVILDPEPAPARATEARTGSVALRAVELPGYLDMDQLVMRTGDNEIRYSKDERWAEPLDAAVPRILTADLESRLGSELRPPGSSADAWIDVSIERFETDDTRRTELRARWAVHAHGEVKTGEARLVDEQGKSAAAGMSRLLGKLGDAIAADIRGDTVTARNIP
jgi:uncharacterized lipoprotein YmbA